MPSRGQKPDTSKLLTADLLAGARDDPARKWAAGALCAGADPAVFFPPGDHPAAEARSICAMCPVRNQCLAYSVLADEPFGVWGGLDRHERHALRRQLQRRGELPPPASGSAA
jgi:WhiB family transcriptional regulator, redox-sensing transcriptional regulator